MPSSRTFRSSSRVAAALLLLFLFAALPLRAQDPPKPKRSVLLVTLDTTRRDYLGFMGRNPSPTPMLDHLAQVSVLFADAVTTAPLTLPAHASLLTGLYPSSHGVRDNTLFRVPPEARSLAEILKQHGWATGADVGAFVLDPMFGLDQGFDRYRAPPRALARPGAPAKDELPAGVVIDRALKDLHELPQPFFYWVHLFDAHYPYEPPEPPQLPPEVAADPIRTGKAMYEAEIAYMDRELGRLFAELQSMGLLEQMVVVVAADHGESLFDAPEGSHGFYLYDPTVRVPLLLRHPDVTPQLVTLPVSLVDVAPTLLALLGVDASSERFDGIDLSPWLADVTNPPPDRALLLESFFAWYGYGWAPSTGCTLGALKLIRSRRTELYDRSQDAAERHDLFAPDEPRVVALSRRLDALLGAATPLAPPSAGLTESDRARLQRLGYATSGPGAPAPQDWSELPDPHEKAASIYRFNQVMLAVAQQQGTQAIDLLRALVVDEPGSATFHEQLALMLLNGGPANVAEAKAQLDAALKLDARRSRCWLARAQCAEIDASVERAAAKDARDRGQAAEARPHSERERAGHELAESALRTSLDLEPDMPEALVLLGRLVSDRAERSLRRDDQAAAKAAFGEVAAIYDRLVAVLPSNSPEWADAAAGRQRLRARLEALGAGK